MGTDSPGRRLATALAAKDAAALRAVLTDDVDFTGLTPRRTWSARDPDEVLDVLLGHWFAPEDEVEELLDVSEGAPVEDTRHVAYRLRLATPDGAHTAEQQAYYRTEGERISYLRVLCSGFRPAAG